MEQVAAYLDDPEWTSRSVEALDLKCREHGDFARIIEMAERQWRLEEIPLE